MNIDTPAWQQAYEQWARTPKALPTFEQAFRAGWEACDAAWLDQVKLLPVRRAAPQLLEACKAMAEAKRLSRGLTRPDDIEMAKQAYAAAMVKIEKAIAAAEGKP